MRIYYIIFSLFAFSFSFAQENNLKDSLLAGIHFEHTNYDVLHYDLSVSFDLDNRQLKGKNKVMYKVLEDNDVIQLDLQSKMKIDSIVFENTQCSFERKFASFFIQLPRKTQKGEVLKVTIYYQGPMMVAQKAPWDGGFVFLTDENKQDFVGVACQNNGASSWWPTKELMADKCDSADLHFEVKKPLQAIANGQLINVEEKAETTVYHWKVSYPINNYNISVTIGDFAHLRDEYRYKNTRYPLDYYVLKSNEEKARKHFKQVKPMLKVFEKLYGAYPFENDGYKLIEAPYAGMEHQSGIAYGNQFENGYLRRYFSEANRKFDFIIVHESGHEYWGNNVCMADRSDMWIHEAFCTYTELLYIEKRWGKHHIPETINYWKNSTKNFESLVNERYSNKEPTTDIYYKGALLLHTIRSYVNNDALFLACLKAIQKEFSLKTVDTPTILSFMDDFLKINVSQLMEHYLYEVSPPILNFTLTPSLNGKGYNFGYQWDAVSETFEMPFEFYYGKKKYTLNGTAKRQVLYIPSKKIKQVEFDTVKRYYIPKYE